MRFSRLLAAILTAALLGLPFIGTTAANAADATVSAKAPKEVTAKIKRKNGGLVMVGNVKPRRGPVVIQRATNCRNNNADSCNWKGWRKVGTNKKGRYVGKVAAPNSGVWYWRARVLSTTSDVWVTCRSTTGSC